MSKERVGLRLTPEIIKHLKNKKKGGLDYSDYVTELIKQDMLRENHVKVNSNEMFRDIKLIRLLLTEFIKKSDQDTLDKAFDDFIKAYPNDS